MSSTFQEELEKLTPAMRLAAERYVSDRAAIFEVMNSQKAVLLASRIIAYEKARTKEKESGG